MITNIEDSGFSNFSFVLHLCLGFTLCICSKPSCSSSVLGLGTKSLLLRAWTKALFLTLQFCVSKSRSLASFFRTCSLGGHPHSYTLIIMDRPWLRCLIGFIALHVFHWFLVCDVLPSLVFPGLSKLNPMNIGSHLTYT